MFLCDFHVHIYDCFSPATVLESAAGNFAAIVQELGVDVSGCFLFLTESCGYDWFSRMRHGQEGVDGWQLERTGEVDSFALARDRDRLVVVAGRQILTAEAIEVLSLASSVRVEDGLPLAETIDRVQRLGGIPVLPWGVGKWLGNRGRTVERVFRTARQPLLVGDNRGRPPGWPEPPLFSRAREEGRPILPGSDPLPLPGEEKTIASYCGLIAVRDTGIPPAAWFRANLASLGEVRQAGRRVSLGAFAATQMSLRFRRRCGKNEA